MVDGFEQSCKICGGKHPTGACIDIPTNAFENKPGDNVDNSISRALQLVDSYVLKMYSDRKEAEIDPKIESEYRDITTELEPISQRTEKLANQALLGEAQWQNEPGQNADYNISIGLRLVEKHIDDLFRARKEKETIPEVETEYRNIMEELRAISKRTESLANEVLSKDSTLGASHI